MKPVFGILEDSYPEIGQNKKYQNWKKIHLYMNDLQHLVDSLPFYQQWLSTPNQKEYVYIPDEKEDLEVEDGMDDM